MHCFRLVQSRLSLPRRAALAAAFLSILAALFVTRSSPPLGATAASNDSNLQVATDPAVVGQWSPAVGWPLVAVHAVLMNNGKVLNWQSGAAAKVWNPATGVFTDTPNSFTDIFCNGHVQLPNGKVVALGGGGPGPASATANVDLFDPQTQTWTPSTRMALKRWYPTGTVLPDGRILATGGADGCVTCYVQTPEVYDPVTEIWTLLSGAANLSTPSYPFMFVLPDGRVIQAGGSEIAIATHVLDVGSRTWSLVDDRIINGGSAVMYSPGLIMKAGSASDSGFSGPSSNTTFVLDMTRLNPAWRQTASMSFARSFLNLTVLPDGNVLATGGGTTRDGMNVANAVKEAELWSPAGETWTTMARMQTPRLYHSIALLLPDARVLVAGMGADGGVADQLSAEIFSPAYLFKGARPTIASSPQTLQYGTHFAVASPDSARIASVSLVRNSAVTHATNMEQRYLNLAFTPAADGLDVTAPANSNLAPPGNYMLFLVDVNGVPSMASFVQLPLPGADVVPPTAPTNLQASAGAGTVNLSWTASTDSVGVTLYNIHRSTQPGFTVSAANRIGQSSTTSYTDAGLPPGTYYYRVTAQDAATNVSVSSNEAAATVLGDTTPPSVTTTAPANGATGIAPTSAITATFSEAIDPTTISTSSFELRTPSNALVAAIVTYDSNSKMATLRPNAPLANSTVYSANLKGGAVGVKDLVGNPLASDVAWSFTTVTPAAGLAVDKVVFSDGAGTRTITGFNTVAPGEVLVAFAASDGPSSSGLTLTLSGAGLAWTLVRRVNTQPGTSEIWRATATSVLTNVSITSTPSVANFDQSLTLVAFTGASGTGATAIGNATTGAPTVSLTTTQPGSLVYGVGNDWDKAVARTVGASQTMVHQFLAPSGDTMWTQSRSAAVASAGTVVQINDTAPTTDRWNLVAVEILASPGGVVSVPNVVNLTQTAATTAITNAGLVLGTVTTAASSTVAAGSVISQTPTAGTPVTPGSAVNLVVSTGPVSVPDVVNLTQTAATTAITNAGLIVGTVTNAASSTVAAGSVVSQTPTAGTPVAPGTAVNLTVSTGPAPVSVPDVVNLTQTAATTAITNAGLIIGTVTTAASSTIAAGSVISQTPTAGTPVVPGSAVNLVVSTGPVSVPDVVNLTQTAATTAITNAGLVVGTVTNAESSTVAAGSVISQTPTAGTPVASGSAVDLVVSAGPAAVSVPNVVNLTQTAATAAITNAGLVVGTVTTAASSTVAAGSVVSQTPAAGTPVAPGSAVNLVVSTGPVSVPNVVNSTQTAATTAITNAGLVLGTVTTAASLTVPAGSVISQTPTAGTPVAPGSAVNLVVSTGPVSVPNVVNLTQTAATTAITNAGLVVGTVTNASSSTVAAGSVISQTPTAGTPVAPGSAVNLVVSTGPPSGSGPVVDTVVFSDGAGTRTTAPFSTIVAGDVLVAFVASDGRGSGGQTVTVSGAGLTWTLVRRSNTRAGTSEIWQARATGQLTNVTVQSVQSVAGFRQSLTVVAFRGASGVGASAAANAATGAPSVTLVTTRANSLVYGVGNDWDRAVARTLGANQTMVHQVVDTAAGDTFWVQNRNGMVAAAGTSVQLNDTAPTNDRWNFASVEIVP
jgi:beta-lactam-binding protein with PASTA domain